MEKERRGLETRFGEGAENQAMLQSNGMGMSHMHRVGTISAVDGNINAYWYQQILDDNLWSVLAHHYVFQDDNAPVQSARFTQDYLHRNGIRTMSWPAHSPDIIIIENIWLLIKRNFRVGRIENKEDVFHEIQRKWTENTSEYIKSLYQTIPRRLESVIRLKGHLTTY